jgi:hypothetical protein
VQLIRASTTTDSAILTNPVITTGAKYHGRFIAIILADRNSAERLKEHVARLLSKEGRRRESEKAGG